MPIPLPELEKQARRIGEVIGGAIPEGVGFALLLFDFGEGGHLTYISNGARDDMLKAMAEFMQKQGH